MGLSAKTSKDTRVETRTSAAALGSYPTLGSSSSFSVLGDKSFVKSGHGKRCATPYRRLGSHLQLARIKEVSARLVLLGRTGCRAIVPSYRHVPKWWRFLDVWNCTYDYSREGSLLDHDKQRGAKHESNSIQALDS